MVSHNPLELRQRAECYRELATHGDDLHLKTALLELAVEFEGEAKDIEADRHASDLSLD
jgi:hypothetical protein